VARDLATRIAATLNIQPGQPGMELVGDRDIIDVINQNAVTSNDRNIWLDAARLISQGVVYYNSIDSFIDTHIADTKVQFLGKLAIAKTILQAEQASLLYIDNRMRDANFQGMFPKVPLSETWFVSLFRNLTGFESQRLNEFLRRFPLLYSIMIGASSIFSTTLYKSLMGLMKAMPSRSLLA
jgi:hypothetical protein